MITSEQAQEVAREALARLTKCCAITIDDSLSQEEYDNYTEELLQVIADSALAVLNGAVA